MVVLAVVIQSPGRYSEFSLSVKWGFHVSDSHKFHLVQLLLGFLLLTTIMRKD